MKKLWPTLICLSACALFSCFGKVNDQARDDGYVFYRDGMRFTSKGKQLGYLFPRINVDGEIKKVKYVPYVACRSMGTFYFVCETEGDDNHYLCCANAGDDIGVALARGESYTIDLISGRNLHTKIARVFMGNGKQYFLRDGEIIELESGTLVCPEGDGRVVEEAGGAFYAEGEQRWALPGFSKIAALNGWMLYYQTTGGYASFDMRSKQVVEIEGRHHFARGRPFSVKEVEGKTAFCYWDEEGRAEERLLDIDCPYDFYLLGGDGIFCFGSTIETKYVYDYAFDRLTRCVEGKPSVYVGDFSYYEDDDYRFYVKNAYEPGHVYLPSYCRLNKKTGEDEFLYRPMETIASATSETLFPSVDWVLPPAN